MTRAQERAIERLKNTFLGLYGYPETKEFKYEKIEEFENGVVYVSLEVGSKGDEGTLASIICRNNLSVLIGKKGGYYNYSDSKSHYRKTYNSAVDVCCRAQWK